MNTAPTPDPTRGHVDTDLKAYVDGELGPLHRFKVARHLAGCARCREKELEMKKITDTLRDWGGAKNAALSPDLRATLLAHGPTGPSTDVTPQMPLWRRSPGLVFGGGTLSLAASLAAFAFLYNTANQSGTETAAVAPPQAAVAASAPMGVTSEAAPAATSRAEPEAAAGYGGAPAPSADYTQGLSNGNELPRRVISRFDKRESAKADRAVTPGVAAGPVSSAAPQAIYEPRRIAQLPRPQTAQEWAADTQPPSSLSIDSRRVHREASLGVAVDNPEAASAKVETLVKEWGGYVASNVLTTDASGYKSADLTLKVPEERFDEMLTSLGKMGDIRSKNITGEDITEQTSDATSDEQVLIDETSKLESRLKNQSLSERRTQQTEAQLRQVRQELARTRARLGLLRKLARLSTLNVTLTEKKKAETGAAPTSGFWHDMKDSNRAALKAFQAAVRVPLLLAIWAIALCPLWLPLVLVYRHLSRKAQAQTGVGDTAPLSAAPAPSPAALDR